MEHKEYLELIEMGFDNDWIKDMIHDGWCVKEIKKACQKWGVPAFMFSYEDLDKDDILNGYGIFIDPKFHEVTEICKWDTLNINAIDCGFNGFKTDEDAAKQAEKDGIKIAWDLTEPSRILFGEEHFIIDTMENRKMFKALMKDTRKHI